jgi:hypothetical protein
LDLDGFFRMIKERKMGKKCGTWDVRWLWRSCSLKTIARYLAKYKLHLLGVQGVM